jgi:hypothetical protein
MRGNSSLLELEESALFGVPVLFVSQSLVCRSSISAEERTLRIDARARLQAPSSEAIRHLEHSEHCSHFGWFLPRGHRSRSVEHEPSWLGAAPASQVSICPAQEPGLALSTD